MSSKAMKLALDALEHAEKDSSDFQRINTDQTSAAIASLRTAIQQAEAQQPATGEPVAWNSIQIASWIGSQLMHEPSMFERAAVCKFVRSLGRHPTLLKHSPKLHPAPSVPADVARDAERYRWLRDEHIGNCPESINLSHGRKPGLDAAIDAAMLAAKEAK